MKKFFKDYNIEDLIKIQNMDAATYNKFIDEHLFIECSACGHDYRYRESPVLENYIWQDVVSFYKLNKLNDFMSSQKSIAKVYKKGSAESKLARINTVIQIDKEPYCCICRDCMEKALKRPIKASDLVNCDMNNEIIKAL